MKHNNGKGGEENMTNSYQNFPDADTNLELTIKLSDLHTHTHTHKADYLLFYSPTLVVINIP